MNDGAQAVVLAVISLLGGAFGKTLLDRWFDRDRDRLRQAGQASERQAKHASIEHGRQFADNEQARLWLREQLDERDTDLANLRQSERDLLKRVGELAAQVARQEERSTAQALRIDDLSATVARLGADYAEMKSERDQYRDQKHAVENKLTGETLGRQLAEREVAARDQEIERLHGQIAALSAPKEGHHD